MTITQLRKRVELWLNRMQPLGIRHWAIELSIVNVVENERQVEANASCTCASHYDKMWLEFRKDFIDSADEEDLDRTIVHELLHASMRDLDHVSEGVSEYLGEPHRSVYQESLMHATEGLVERLAWTIILAYR